MATILKKPLVPEHAKPRACARFRCGMRLERLDDPEGTTVAFVHEDPDGSVDEYLIPKVRLADGGYNVWERDIKPWLTQLHEPPAR